MTLYDKEYWDKMGGLDEPKHYWDALLWLEHFKPKTVLDIGCGLGHRVGAIQWNDPSVSVEGCDISTEGIKKAKKMYPECKFKVSDILKLDYEDNFADLIICYDVFEHLEPQEAVDAIGELCRVSKKWVLASICYNTDPNYPLDPTHKTCKTRDWWFHHFERRDMINEETPRDFPFYGQISIWRKDGKS